MAVEQSAVLDALKDANRLLIVGGALYTVGGVMYALRRPDPWPRTFGYHEFFHAATVLAAICHHVAIWLALFPG